MTTFFCVMAYFLTKKRPWMITFILTAVFLALQAATHLNFYNNSQSTVDKIPEYPVFTFSVQLLSHYLFVNTNYLLT